MNLNDTGLVTEKEILLEMKQYKIIVESIVGISFLAIISICLGTDNPCRTSWFFLPAVIGLFIYMWSSFPQTLNALKEIKKQKNTYKKEEIDIVNNIIKEIEKKTIYSYKILFSHLIYFYSAMIYFSILLFPELGLSIKTGTWANSILALL